MRVATGRRANVARARRAAVCVALALACASARASAAEDGTVARSSRPGDPAAPQALGRVFAAGPTAPALFLVSTGGYGYTESVLNTADTHHRAAGSVAVEGRPVDWLGLALRLDGRYDRHESAQGTDDGWIGDPRVFLRLDHALGAAFRAGARLGVWFPGRAAPSIDLAATTPELTGALTCALPGSPVWLTANAGYRVNRSARTATDASQLSASDRLGLELSAYDQALLGLAAVYGDGRAQGFLELSAELMVGAGSPPASASPLRAGGGMRLAHQPGSSPGNPGGGGRGRRAPRCRCPALSFPFRRARRSGSASLTGSAPTRARRLCTAPNHRRRPHHPLLRSSQRSTGTSWPPTARR